MEFLKRAIKNNYRNKTKFILLLITFMVIINLVLVGFSINNTGERLTDNIRKKLGSDATYELDYDKFYNSLTEDDYNKSIPPLSIETAEKIGKISYVKNYTLTISGNMGSKKDTKVYINSKDKKKFADWIANNESNEVLNVIGGNANLPNDFIEKKLSFKEGNFYTKEDIESKNKVVVISSSFARLNGYKLGDTIDLKFYVNEYDENYNIKKVNEITNSFKIVGLFDVANSSASSSAYSPIEAYKENTAYIPYSVYVDMDKERYKQNIGIYMTDTLVSDKIGISDYAPSFTIKYTIDDPKNLEAFKEEAEKLLTTEYHKIDIKDEQFKQLSKPINSVRDLARLVTFVIIGFGTVIIALVTALSLKDRKFEIGILLSLGESKIKIISQIFMELFIVSFIAFTISIGTGSLLNKTVGDHLLQNSITNMEEESEENDGDGVIMFESSSISEMKIIDDSFYPGSEENVDMDEIKSSANVGISASVLTKVAVSGLFIIFISTLIPALLIMRFNPKRILTDR